MANLKHAIHMAGLATLFSVALATFANGQFIAAPTQVEYAPTPVVGSSYATISTWRPATIVQPAPIFQSATIVQPAAVYRPVSIVEAPAIQPVSSYYPTQLIWRQVPVTSYQDTQYLDPATGIQTVVRRPVINWSWQQVPISSDPVYSGRIIPPGNVYSPRGQISSWLGYATQADLDLQNQALTDKIQRTEHSVQLGEQRLGTKISGVESQLQSVNLNLNSLQQQHQSDQLTIKALKVQIEDLQSKQNTEPGAGKPAAR